MAIPSLPFMIFQAALLSFLASSSAPQECNVSPKETPPGAAMGTGLLQTKPAALALEKTGFEESMLKAIGKLEEELKDLKAKDTGLVEELAELKNEDAGLKEELARLESSQSRGAAALAEVPTMPHGRPDLPGIFAQHQNASERRSSCKKPKGPPLASFVGGNISDASELKTKKVEGVFHIFPGKKCRGSPFTVDRDASCDGFTGLSVEQCQKKCADSAKAPNCPQKTCGGAVSFESGWCHLWEECSESELVDSSPATAIIPKAGCPRGEVKLFDFQPAGATQSCCKQACAGCAYFSGNACQRCAGGFILREGQCTACTSSGGWLSVDGKSCMQLAAGDCSDEKVRGQSSNEACCQCGGGVVTPTPFSYPNSRWSLDSNIVLKPEPRTALRYTVDSKCELAAHNLTMDSSTGEISYMAGRAKPLEAFSFECEVTAHQALGVSLASVVTVAADVLSYSSVTLLFHDDSEEKLPLTTGSGWSKFELGCAPEVSWLSIVASTGALRYAAPSGATGGVSVADDILFGQDGAVCVVTAWQTHKKHQTTFVAIRPRPWPTLRYDLDAVAVSVGEDLHPLNPKPHKEQGLMKPWAFSMACDVSGAASSTRFTYDRILNMGLLDGHPILDISPDGAITVAPAGTLSELFDALSVSGSQRKAFTLGCRVFGLFPDPDLPPVETTLTIVVQDTVCWVPQNIKGTGLPHASADTEAKCRSQCRADETCANYKFEGQCTRYDVRSDGNPVTVVAKVTNCTNEGTCMKVTHSEWYLAGTYCPLGRDAVLGGIVYLREHVTQQDMVYLREGSSGGCGANQWALMAPSSADFIDKALALFELRGTRHACISSSSLEHSLSWCATKALAWIEEQEEDEEGQPALVLDDPGTAQPADFWLHPCDCAPDAWGADLPVDAQMYEQLPANSSNKFIPTPYVIVTGQLVCPSRQLLGGGMGVHFQSEEEVLEPADCEARCREQSTCLFFWHGSQHGASTCRLFSGCDNLVREFSLEGDLKAMPRSPSCTVADAVKCWATSLRRSFLSMAFSPSGGNSASASACSAAALNLPPKPAAPPAAGMVAWFESENAGSVWRSSVGDFEGHCSLNTVYRQVEAGNGADRPVTFIEGYTWSGYSFGNVIPPTHTVCTVSRYGRQPNGASHRGRILQSSAHHNWLHGHWATRTGVVYYNGWLTDDQRNIDVMDWVVLCGTNGAQRAFDGSSPGTPANIADHNPHPPVRFTETIPLYVNHGADEKSDFAVMEVITWDRVLSEAEMVATVEYLKWKLRAGAVLEASERLAPETEKNFDSWGNQQLTHVSHQTFEVDLANGYTADLTGWPLTRDYARGFLTNIAGVATAVVKGLMPAAKYLYQIYMVHERTDWAGEAKMSVNHGVQCRGVGDSRNGAKFSGVAVASPRGEINFEFERVSHHLDLSGIAIAKVGQPPVIAKPADPPSQGMYAWFKSENAGSVWRSSVGDFEGHCNVGTVFRRVAAGNGADRPVTFIEGYTWSGYDFGNVIPPTHTVCAVTRYSGPHKGRILQSRVQNNWLHGHWARRTGVAYYNGWLTDDQRNIDVEDWVVLCGTNGAQRAFDGSSPGTPANIADHDPYPPVAFTETIPLYINHGWDEKSEFHVMEVITWDRVLSEAEMVATVEYLKWKLRAGAVLEASEHLAQETEKNFDSWGNQHLNDVSHQTFEVDLANGYKADLTGWPHTRDYARGFLTNKHGVSTAVVKGLTPAAQYLYQIYMVHEITHWAGAAKVSVNHGVQGTCSADSFNEAKFSGVAVASPRGEINFEFEKVSVHLDLSGIAIAKVSSPASLLQEASIATGRLEGAVEQGFMDLHLYQQCDSILMLGGMGVEHCGRPSHREITSHDWQHKRPLPPSFEHGAVLMASCWSERYRMLRENQITDTERLQCVNGDWYNSLRRPGLNGLVCEGCVQVAARGYAAYDKRNEQELYFFNRMALSIYTELGMIKELDAQARHMYCLQPSTDGNMTVQASSTCPAKLLSQVTGWAGPEARLFKLLPSSEGAAALQQNAAGPSSWTFAEHSTWTATFSGCAKILVVGGGGGGGGRSGGGGAGGGLVTMDCFEVTQGTSYTVEVGAGGAGGSADGGDGSAGGDSKFGELVAKGGGGGGSDGQNKGHNGGSGGGGKYGESGGEALQNSQAGQSGEFGFGHNGGSGTSGTWNAGGGGGAGAVGEPGDSSHCGDGGKGKEICILGTCDFYAAGGGGGSHDPACTSGGEGGKGGGGDCGTPGGKNPGTRGEDGKGSGGGGGSTNSGHGGAGGNGGKGIVIIEEKKADQCLSTKGNSSGLMHVECNATNAAQHLEPAELPTDMWHLHIEADERTQDLHKPFSSYCGTSGALSSLDFGQLFAGDTGTSQTTCKFAPLIQFGSFVDTGIVRSKTTTNWPNWHHLLAENYVECASGEALTAFKLDAAKNIYKYECSKIGGLGSCFDYYSAQVEIASFDQSIHHWAQPIRMLPVSCGQNAVLGSFHFEFSEGGKWGRVRYQCCKAGGAPVSFDPRGQYPELVGRYDGIYCPSGRDSHNGRLKFASTVSGLTLSFKRSTGQWCVGSECSEVTDSESPLGMEGAAFEVVNVSDFDGEFLGQMPKEEKKALSLKEALRMKPPRRPPPPKMPELEEFRAQQPKYAEECLNYENLWQDVTETYLDEEDEEVQKREKLEADPSTKEQALDSYHPCEVAKNAGGIFGMWGGGDGSMAPENMMYADWNDCMQGDIERDLAAASFDWHGALADYSSDLLEATMGAMCGFTPDVPIAPFGMGIELDPGAICDGLAGYIAAISRVSGSSSGEHMARQGWSIEQEGYAACNPMQIGFARAFCDIHCVRDAVVRGDRSIIRNLEMATKKTNNNLKALVKWSVDASHTDIGWIGEKLDYMHAINTAYMQEIHEMVTKQSEAEEEQLLQGTESATDAMFSELAGYAQAASFDEISKITAKRAIEEFLESADLPPKANATAAASLLGRLDALHQTLQRAGRGREKSEMLNRQVARTVRHLQHQASFHLRTLGVYRQESNASSHAARGKGHKALARERHQVLMSLDHIWWQLRTKLDAYLDVAEDEVKAFQTSLAEMNSYLDCKKGFSDLAAGYAQSMSALSRSHRQLRSTWRQGTSLLGELASVLADTEAFKGFVAEQGCTSELVKQTLQQLQSGIFGMAFLLHRFRASKLPEPDTAALRQATQRIQEAYAAATAKCH